MHVDYSGFRPSTVIIYFYGGNEENAILVILLLVIENCIHTLACLAGDQLSTAQYNHACGTPNTLLTSA